MNEKDVTRFWSKVDKEKSKIFYEGKRCWEWMGSLNTDGYGRLWVDRDNKYAHRLSYEIAFGEIHDSLSVLHHCDNPSCIRPDHLFLGTHQDNIDDMMRKGRRVWQSGENGNSAKLTDAQVSEIRRLHAKGVRNTVLSEKFGIHQTYISNIVCFRNRK